MTTNCAEQFTSVTGEGRSRVRLTAGGLQPGTAYYVRLTNAFNPGSVNFRLTVRNEMPLPGCVSQLAPADGAANINFDLPQTFRWSAAPGAVRYELSLTAPGIFYQRYYTSDTTYSVRVPQGQYTWNVRAVNALDGTSGYCDTAVFQTCAAAANAVTIAHPGYNAFCTGSSVTFRASANPAGAQWFRDYFPIPGATADTLLVQETGTYSLRILGADGCYSNPSNYLGATALPLPYKPQVTAVGAADICNGSNTVRLTAAGLYNAQWQRLEGGINAWVDTLSVTQAGNYFVRINGTNGCNNYSDTFQVHSLSTPPAYSINAAGNVLSVTAGHAYYQWFRDGSAINGATTNTYSALESGVYRVDVGNSASCKTSSFTLAFASTAVSSVELEGTLVTLYPNPVRADLFVRIGGSTRNRSFRLQLLDAQGRLVKTAALRPGTNVLALPGLPAGVYHAVVSDGRSRSSLRVVKVN